MSVYTEVTKEQLIPFTLARNLGQPETLAGIAQGVVNTNYHLCTPTGEYILTLVENPKDAESLPQVVQLLLDLSEQNFPVPQPLKDLQGKVIFTLAHRPALLVTRLPGVSPLQPNPAQCRDAGLWLARLHGQKKSLSLIPENPMGMKKWQHLLAQLTGQANPLPPGLSSWLKEEMGWLETHWLPLPLSKGLCHGDLFPDNTLFVGDRLTGMIDFYYACHESKLYDLAVALLSWCFHDSGIPDHPRVNALLAGYLLEEPMAAGEMEFLPTACRAAALRFTLTRLHAQCFPRSGDQVTRRNPEAFMARLNFLQKDAMGSWLKG